MTRYHNKENTLIIFKNVTRPHKQNHNFSVDFISVLTNSKKWRRSRDAWNPSPNPQLPPHPNSKWHVEFSQPISRQVPATTYPRVATYLGHQRITSSTWFGVRGALHESVVGVAPTTDPLGNDEDPGKCTFQLEYLSLLRIWNNTTVHALGCVCGESHKVVIRRQPLCCVVLTSDRDSLRLRFCDVRERKRSVWFCG